MKLPSGRERVLLFSCLGLAALLIVLIAVLTPSEGEDFPSTYNTDTHGAKAAYLLLGQLGAPRGVQVERWTRPLPELIPSVDAHTVLILPSPDGAEPTARTVHAVLEHGGRVITVGFLGAAILPDASAVPAEGPAYDCKAEANGFSDVNSSQDVRLRTTTTWAAEGPRFHVDYTCDGLPLAVHYAVGQGQAIWWADALPIENAGIREGGNLGLVLAAVGPMPRGTRIVWDEAPPSEPASLWSYAEGTPLSLVGWQLALVALLLLVSVSRRSGPLRPDPVLSRAAPIEFVAALGALYARANATNQAVTLAYRGFLDRIDRYVPVRALDEVSGAEAVAERLLTSVPAASARASLEQDLERDLVAASAARYSDKLTARRALRLVRRLHEHEQQLQRVLQPQRTLMPAKERLS